MKLNNFLKKLLEKAIIIKEVLANVIKKVMSFNLEKNIGLMLHIDKNAINDLIKNFIYISAKYENSKFYNIKINKIYLSMELEENNIIKQISFIRNF